MIAVRKAHKMSDENFRTHLELRHIPAGDFADLTAFHPGSTFAANRPTHETYHAHLHRSHPERYDHEH